MFVLQWVGRRMAFGILGIVLCVCVVEAAEHPPKLRVFVVSSYHPEYQWSQETNIGLCDAMLKFGYLDSPEQIATYTKAFEVESSSTIMKKVWMDTKRKSSKSEMSDAAVAIAEQIKAFGPDVLLLGDDNAANYVGNQFLDTDVTIIFWGVNNTPVKYGLVDTVEHPGHNVTGVFQSGYYLESLQFLKTLVPSAKTFAILTDGSETGRSHLKAIEALSRDGVLPMTLAGSVATNEFVEWQQQALALQEHVDAFYVAQYSSLKDSSGGYIPAEAIAQWYLQHIHIPEATNMEQFVKQGLFSAANDSAYNQGYEAIVVMHDLLTNHTKPANYPPRAPRRGHLMVNLPRAKMLGMTITPEMGVEQTVTTMVELSEPSTHSP